MKMDGPNSVRLAVQVAEYVPLLLHATGPDRHELTAVRHSENTTAFLGLQDGPVKGMSI